MEEIVTLANEIEASHVILGRPQEEGREDVFTTERLASFVEQLEAETGSKVVLTDTGGEG
jgi:RNase H-fold protein (predicted Holliday junction resolvase)